MILADPQSSDDFGRALADLIRCGDVVTMAGPLGAGKTSIARGIMAALGYEGEVPSPSFALVIPYDAPPLRLPVWHVDLYRLDDPEQVEELGLRDVLADGVLLIEWPEKAGESSWKDALSLMVEIMPDETRRLTAKVPPSWESRWHFQ